MATAYADSGLGWIADEEYFQYDPGALCTLLGLEYRKTVAGSVVYAIVYLPHLGTTGPVVLSTVSSYAEYTDGVNSVKSQGTIDYIGRTWYITAFTGWQQGDRIDTSGHAHKLTVDSPNLYDIATTVLDAAKVTRKPRDPTQKKNFQINYTGSSKVIRRLCERINNMALLGIEHNEAFYGDWGNEAYLHSQLKSGNPHQVSLADLGIDFTMRQVRTLLDALGSIALWGDHQDAIIADHDGTPIILQTSNAQFLAWH